MINVMNTSAITNQTYDTGTDTLCDKGNGFLRRCIAVTLLIMASTATAVGFAATSHADNGAPAPNGEMAITVPTHVAPWLPRIDQTDRFGHLHCGYRWGHFQCFRY